MKFTDIKLKTRINTTFAVLLLLVFTVLAIVITSYLKKSIVHNADKQMTTHLHDLVDILNTHVDGQQSVINLSLKIAHNTLYNSGGITESKEKINTSISNQDNDKSSNYSLSTLLFNGEAIYHNNQLVDHIKSQSVESITIFQKIKDGYARIATNVLNKDGKRAVDTYIPNSSEVIKTIEQNKTYYGRAFVVDDWYLTAYEPIKINGEIKAILYVGIKEKDYDYLKHQFSSRTYFSEGYPILVESNGNILIHPNAEGQNTSKDIFYKQMVNAPKNIVGQSRYQWPDNKNGEWKQQYFQYYEPYDSYVVVSIYEKDMYESLMVLNKIIIVGIIISLILAFIGIYFLLQPVLFGINKIAEVSSKIAQGELDVDVNINSKDEIGQTASSLKSMSEKLKEIITEVINGSNNIANASEQLSNASQELSQHASEQAASVEEISSSIEEIASNISQNTHNALINESICTNTGKGIDELNFDTEQTIQANKIIAEKTKIIGEIAKQTNILALNAAVEAANSGEHGRGFAVVAAEVRKLAERSKIASEDIIKNVDNGVKTAILTGDKMKSLLPQIEQSTNLIKEITAASQEQDTGATQINSSVQQLNYVTQQNAAASEELASSSEELSAQAEKLKDLISFFKVDKTAVIKQKSVKKPIQAEEKKVERKGTELKLDIDIPTKKEYFENEEYQSF
ncbi:methyl-accepting chemotaxis protein [Plebeiibacterium sediminum]|uniref:Cache 3/Cache 2 fusion domain-containing protein n=1 Tax=Plebeiibacterium sediminum TaxID=2992112 RepID=A0AAE3SEU8_9BACT|nr:Cache 3/Cache 2 fusion domain-containing protein [Plebeiobacterium sediminum]MCW3786868.1 Cache 3/Cache 2 fusion domain-containing protein [Plebeiobacterium sediminum]